jgi:hypothetical protein
MQFSAITARISARLPERLSPVRDGGVDDVDERLLTFRHRRCG